MPLFARTVPPFWAMVTTESIGPSGPDRIMADAVSTSQGPTKSSSSAPSKINTP